MTINARLAPTRLLPRRATLPYQGVALELLRHVVDVLRALENDQSARTPLAIFGDRYALGVPSGSPWPTAWQQRQQTRIGLLAAQSQQPIDSTTSREAPGGEQPGMGENMWRKWLSGI